ncbi:MAG TPA: VOC family protein [Phenylobacterium sp.]
MTEAAQMQHPQVKGGVAPYLIIDGASAAIDFYKRAFGAEEMARMPAEDGKRLMHAHIYINGASVLLNDFFPEYGHPPQAPAGFNLHIQLDDVDSWWKRAVDAGCEVVMPLETQFWGDRYGQLKDPFGVIWSLAQSAS